ncbi:MAG: hypothetical protein E4H27_05730 [Anaerolineales bacterium]|nr:MAG: hypothetical protein E4H27_05730 [Anaerolineales bacterium]
MAWTNAIVQLQDTDLELLSNQKRLGDLVPLLKDSSAMLIAQERLDAAKTAAKQARQNQETLEFEFGRVQNKLRVDTEKLYSGRITNARELQDLQAETESLKRHLAEIEEKLLEAMMVREEADAQVSEANTALEAIREKTKTSQQHLVDEQAKLSIRNTTLAALQEKLRKQIPASILDTYEYLKSRTGNIPVAQLNGEICSICGIEVIKPVQQKARHDEEAYCGGCNRLLVILD